MSLDHTPRAAAKSERCTSEVLKFAGTVCRPCTNSLTPEPTDTGLYVPSLLATVDGEPQNADAFKIRECEQDETRRPKPKTAIVEAGMHPHPGPKAATAAEAMEKAAK